MRLSFPTRPSLPNVSGHVLGLLGEDITINGCVLRSPRFAVTIYNGCNGLITSLIFISGVLAFPAKMVGQGHRSRRRSAGHPGHQPGADHLALLHRHLPAEAVQLVPYLHLAVVGDPGRGDSLDRLGSSLCHSAEEGRRNDCGSVSTGDPAHRRTDHGRTGRLYRSFLKTPATDLAGGDGGVAWLLRPVLDTAVSGFAQLLIRSFEYPAGDATRRRRSRGRRSTASDFRTDSGIPGDPADRETLQHHRLCSLSTWPCRDPFSRRQLERLFMGWCILYLTRP